MEPKKALKIENETASKSSPVFAMGRSAYQGGPHVVESWPSHTVGIPFPIKRGEPLDRLSLEGLQHEVLAARWRRLGNQKGSSQSELSCIYQDINVLAQAIAGHPLPKNYIDANFILNSHA